jgi:YegS/Rv2252/BmrU family lipid kinase
MSKHRKLSIIANPAAGGYESALAVVAPIFSDAGFECAIHLSRNPGDVYTLTKEMAPASQLIAVYGGDGSVMEAARALHGSATTLAILPGGTANVMAKELGIPLDFETAARLLVSPDAVVRKIDMGIVNDVPFLIRVNLGLLADMITATAPEMKERWGQLAYGLTAFQQLDKANSRFQLLIDGAPVTLEAMALTVTNAGNVGRKGYSFLPGISVTDGLLDVIALDRSDIMALLKVTGSILLQKDSTILKHWQAKEVSILMEEESSWLCDDTEGRATRLDIRVSPASLRLLTPAREAE